MSDPTDQQLRAAAHRHYGVNCSQSYCKAGGGERIIVLPDDLQKERDTDYQGTWITARIFIADDEP